MGGEAYHARAPGVMRSPATMPPGDMGAAAPADADVVVIGSGAGGLAAAVALAQAGRSVLVLEQHYLPGGWCHSFPLGGFRWSPGVHYVGELGPGKMARHVYEGLGLGRDLAFHELDPEGYDEIRVGAHEPFAIPAGRERLVARLAERFPRERAGIQRYVETTSRIGEGLATLLDVEGPLGAMAIPFRAPALARWALSSAKSLIDAHVEDPHLRAILAAQSGDHGLPPSMAPAPLHAAVFGHYADGGYYPEGGAASLPRAFLRALSGARGSIRVRTRVERILVERGRAIGVRLEGGHEIRARLVVSNADPGVTYGRLLAPEDVPPRLVRKLARARYSTSAISLFLAVDVDPRRYGLGSANVWQFESDDVDGIYRRGLAPAALEGERIPFLFLSATTLKDPSKRYRDPDTRRELHTLEAFTLVGYDAFRAWAETEHDARPESYEARKRELTERMLAAVERVAPGLTAHAVFTELGTPLTNEHYVAATAGNMYGTEKTRDQIGPFAWPIRTPIEGLLCCGASTLSHGVMGATISGLVAARTALGCSFDELLRTGGPPLRIGPRPQPQPVRAAAAS